MSFFPTQHIIRKINSDEKSVYLTFDDGPGDLTTTVLDILKKYNACATFFVIGTRAEKQPQIIKRMIAEGHGVYTHSYDHDYKNYFTNDATVLKWINKSIQHLSGITGTSSPVFRPPAGIITPPVARASLKAGIRLILWNYRFYDSVLKLTPSKISKYINRSQSGDIVLLHDVQRNKNIDSFLKSLVFLIEELQSKRFKLKALDFNADVKIELKF